MIRINFDKAKDIRKNQLRNERSSLLIILDIEFQRALEQGNDTSKIIEEKNRLRDITNLCDVATTLEELKAISCTSPEEQFI